MNPGQQPAPPKSPMGEQLVLRVLAKMMIPFILVFGCYVITHGELGPGGGFQGGAILAAAVILYALVFGIESCKRAVPVRVLDILMALGICLYAGVGVAALLGGRAFLDYSVLDPEHPQHADPLGMTLVEYGVALTVASVMITIFTKLSEERSPEDAPVAGVPGGEPPAHGPPTQDVREGRDS